MIAGLRSRLTPDQLADFKHSDGRLAFAIAEVERLHNLRTTKIAVLEIVWNYLYSGREAEAWKSLRELWPDADFQRMQKEISERRTHGLFSQIDGIAPRARRKEHRPVYQQAEVVPARAMNPSYPEIGVSLPEEVDFDLVIDSAGKVRDIKPRISLDPRIVAQAWTWKFVPATKGGHSVASHLRLVLSLKR